MSPNMNAILESPLEAALAFDYLSFGLFIVVHNIWTIWVVVISAAVSLWRFKSSRMLSELEPRGNISRTQTTPSPPPPPLMLSSSQVQNESSDKQGSRNSDEITSSAATNYMTYFSGASSLVNEDGTNGKFMVYFKQDVGGECNDDYENGVQEGEADGIKLCEEWYENWEKLLKMRNGELEWYCYQDMSMINGNVVRLWDAVVDLGRTQKKKH